MAYVPPHKRHQKGAAVPSPALPPESVRNPKCNPREIIPLYAENCKREWFIVGLQLADESRILNLTRLEPVSTELYRWNSGLALVLKENGEDQTNYHSEKSWNFVAEKVKHDLISSFENLKEDIKNGEFGELKPHLVARFGKVHFRGNYLFPYNSIIGSSLPRETLIILPRSFQTSTPPSFIEYLTNEAIHTTNFTLEEDDKHAYFLELFDKMRPDSLISCKCRVTKDTNQLQLYKIGFNNTRYLVADMSCLDENMDLRIILTAKKYVVDFTDEELGNIKSLVNSAILDSEVKGGLRWPLGKHTTGDDQYTVVEVWHTRFQTYINSSMRLKVRHGNRFNFRTSHGDLEKDISFKMHGIVSLMEDNSDLAFEMLKENLELIWKHFLCT